MSVCVCGGVTSSGDPGSRENEQHSLCVWEPGGGWGGGRAGGWDGVGRQGKKTIEGGTSRLQGHLSPTPHPSSLAQLSSCPRGSDRTCPLLRLSLNTLSQRGKKFCCRQVSQSSQLLNGSPLVCVGKRVPNQSKVLLKSPLGSSLVVALTPELASEEQRSVLFADPQHKPIAKWSGLGGC